MAGVRITDDQGKIYVFLLESQKMLNYGIQAASLSGGTKAGWDYPKTILDTPWGPLGPAAWVRDPVICRIVSDALFEKDFEPQEIPISRYYPAAGEP